MRAALQRGPLHFFAQQKHRELCSLSKSGPRRSSPLRLAATGMVHRMMALAMMDRNTPTSGYLFEPVRTMASAQVQRESQALLDAVRAVLDQADAIPQHHRTNPEVMSQGERDVWAALDVLREAYDRECEGLATPPS
jgi:hypothetical protein